MKKSNQSPRMITALVLCAALPLSGCYKTAEDVVRQASNVGSNGSIPSNVSVSMKVSNSAGQVLFDSSSSLNNGFRTKAGENLLLDARIQNFKPGMSATIQINNSSTPANTLAGKFTTNAEGKISASFAPASSGDYLMRAQVLQNNQVISNETFVASVECANPTFAASSLDGTAISVSGNNGVSTYSASGVVSRANGQAPYRCAFDFNGDGVVDSQLQNCANSQTDILSTYVINRKISVVVADACNTSHTVSKSVVLPAATPAMPGNVFIAAQNSAMSGCANDIRAADVTYRAQNGISSKTPAPCKPIYNNGSFTLECLQNFGMPHSKSFGMKIDVSGLGVYNLALNPGTIDASNAKVSGIRYTTDELSDAAPALQFASSNCTSTVQARVLNAQGIPCAAGESTTAQEATIEVWGSFTCTNVANACGSMTVTGKFDGLYRMADSCIGGGEGGGGIVPITY